jgi:FHS family glucose/mannose:H+ symporter-like MFS transporter
MPALDSPLGPPKDSAAILTRAAYVSFVPIGIGTVLLGPMLPSLSARWSLNYSQAGALFTAQYLASTCAVALSGVLVSRFGFRFAMKLGIFLMATGIALLMEGPKLLGILCIAMYGGGLGIAVPAANLLVAEVNPHRRSASLNWLNFCWSAGAVACPFLVALASRHQQIPLFLRFVAGFSLVVAIGLALLPRRVVEPSARPETGSGTLITIRQNLGAFLALGALFFIYVGTENGFGGWVASYTKTLGDVSSANSLMTPSFFYASLMLGRFLAPAILRIVGDVTLAKFGLILACGGTAGLLLSNGLAGVIASACATGLGLSGVYPITIALLSTEFGSSSNNIGSVMFVSSNIGGGLVPWIVGVFSNRLGTLKAGLIVPLVGCALMFALYLRNWTGTEAKPV